jgi:organic hydroperoxide reductase OsmC/OhrA
MSTYTATVVWTRQPAEAFTDNRYSRAHHWSFDGGVTVAASSSPSVVPLPLSKTDAVDPEEAFVASLSSCHMLFFLFHAAKFGAVVERYEDVAVGVMAKNDQGRQWMSRVTLAPKLTWGPGKTPSASELEVLHHKAHEDCYIANSVKTEVVVTAG